MSAPSLTPVPPTTPPKDAAPLQQKPPSASLYVGDLAPDVAEGSLFELFNAVGPVSSIRVCRDTLTRRSLGYAYVNFHSVVDAERALDSVNSYLINGRPCRIMWSQRDPSIRKTGVGNIFIKNLDLNIGHKELYDTFSQFGNILSCKVALDESGKPKGYGFVHFENQSAADAAVTTVNNNMLLDKKVFVGPFIPRKVRAQQLEKSWTNVFIKDLDQSMTDSELYQKFAEFGHVTSAVVMRKDGASLGFGFVNYEDHESASKAVEQMHGQKLGGKVIYCCRAQKKAEREARLKREWEQLKISKYQGINLYIKNIEDEVDEERLKKEFSAFGAIKSCKIMTDDKGTSKGFGFVCFSAPEESQRAIAEMNNRVLPGLNKPLYVALHEPKEVRRQKLTHNAMQSFRSRGASHEGTTTLGYPPNGQPVYYSGPPTGYPVYPNQMMASMPRGWPQQYQMHAYAAQGVGATGAREKPPTQAPGATRGGRGGAGASRGGAGGARGGRRNNQPANVPTDVATHGEFSLAHVKSLPVDQQKLYLGERLYPVIAQEHQQLAGKITGMFLDAGWDIEELYSLLTIPEKLNDRIEEAINVLERAQSQTQGGESEAAGATSVPSESG